MIIKTMKFLLASVAFLNFTVSVSRADFHNLFWGFGDNNFPGFVYHGEPLELKGGNPHAFSDHSLMITLFFRSGILELSMPDGRSCKGTLDFTNNSLSQGRMERVQASFRPNPSEDACDRMDVLLVSTDSKNNTETSLAESFALYFGASEWPDVRFDLKLVDQVANISFQPSDPCRFAVWSGSMVSLPMLLECDREAVVGLLEQGWIIPFQSTFAEVRDTEAARTMTSVDGWVNPEKPTKITCLFQGDARNVVETWWVKATLIELSEDEIMLSCTKSGPP